MQMPNVRILTKGNCLKLLEIHENQLCKVLEALQ